MTTNRDRILQLVQTSEQALDDDQISRQTEVTPRQTVNVICRQLERDGFLRRRSGVDGKIVNEAIHNNDQPFVPPPSTTSSRDGSAFRPRVLPRPGNVSTSRHMAAPLSGVLVRTGGGQWSEPSVTGYANEAELQTILFEYPQLLPGVAEPLVACREFESGAGPADVLVIHGNGSLVVAECKLAQNPQVRREIIGQVLDYASRLWGMHIDEFERRWQAKTKMSPFDAFGDDAPRVRESVELALRTGQFTLLLAVDGINPDLQRIVEYLNTITSSKTSVLAFEVARIAEAGVEVLIPRVYGEELVSAKTRTTTSNSPGWTVDQFLNWTEINDPTAVAGTRVLVEALESAGWEVKAGAGQTPSLNIALDMPGIGRKWPLAMYSYAGPDPRVVIEFRFEDFKALPEAAHAFATAVAATATTRVQVPEMEAAGFAKRPSTHIRSLLHAEIDPLVQRITKALTGSDSSDGTD